jgi:hypothetical protein
MDYLNENFKIDLVLMYINNIVKWLKNTEYFIELIELIKDLDIYIKLSDMMIKLFDDPNYKGNYDESLLIIMSNFELHTSIPIKIWESNMYFKKLDKNEYYYLEITLFEYFCMKFNEYSFSKEGKIKLNAFMKELLDLYKKGLIKRRSFNLYNSENNNIMKIDNKFTF